MLLRGDKRNETAAQLGTQDLALSTEPPLGRLRWGCRRGMLELDIVLARFMEHCFSVLTVQEIKAYQVLLAYPDPDLWALIQGGKPIEDDNEMAQVIRMLRQY